MYIYYPSCNFTKDSPKTAKRIRDFLKERMPVAKCCMYDKREIKEEDVGLIICQACRENLESKIKVKSLWEYLDEDESFEWPNYDGLKVDLQDCFRDRNEPNVHQAIRNILKKMNIEYAELEANKQHTDFCGTLHFEPKLEENIGLFNQYPNMKISQMPVEVQKQFMSEQVQKYKNEFVVVSCNRCRKGIELGGGKAIHILNLIMETDIEELMEEAR